MVFTKLTVRERDRQAFAGPLLFRCKRLPTYLLNNPMTAKMARIIKMIPCGVRLPPEVVLLAARLDIVRIDWVNSFPLPRTILPMTNPPKNPNRWPVTLMFGCKKVMIKAIAAMVKMICEFCRDISSLRNTIIAI